MIITYLFTEHRHRVVRRDSAVVGEKKRPFVQWKPPKPRPVTMDMARVTPYTLRVNGQVMG